MVTRSAELCDRAWRYKSQGLTKGREYWHEMVGFNFRMTNLSAAIGLAQLERADLFLARKQKIALWYREHLEGLPVALQTKPENVHHTYWLVSVVCEEPESVTPLRKALDVAGIETRPVFPPIHTMPPYRDTRLFPRAEDIASRGFSLPSWPGLDESDLVYITDRIKEFYTNEAIRTCDLGKQTFLASS